MAITGDDLQPENLTTQWNAIFMLTFNLVRTFFGVICLPRLTRSFSVQFGAVIMMALFVSIIIEVSRSPTRSPFELFLL
jgi:hypothetical protein